MNPESKPVTGQAPALCKICSGSSATTCIVEKFSHLDYGHYACRTCSITFDGNVNEALNETPDAQTISSISDENEYKRLFIETSNIGNDSGEIYPDFSWDDNDALKSGIANHVVNSIKKHRGQSEVRMRILDLGCGNGFSSIELSKSLPLATVTAMDPSPTVLSAGKMDRVEPVQGTLDSIAFPDDFFDVVVIVGNLMLHYNPETTLKEAARVLKTDGLLVVDFKNAGSTVRRMVIFFSKIGLKGLLPQKLRERSVLNMRFGFNKTFFRSLVSTLPLKEVGCYSKPPRLLEFKNAASFQAGLSGFIWRFLDKIDGVIDERAWVQMTFRKGITDD